MSVRWGRWLLIVGCAVALGGCGAPPVVLADVPLPPTARATVLEGAYEVPIDLTVGRIRQSLREKYGPVNVTIYALDRQTTWAEVEAFYASRLPSTQWQRDPDNPLVIRSYDQMTWLAQSGQALVVARVPYPEGPDDFLIIVLSADE